MKLTSLFLAFLALTIVAPIACAMGADIAPFAHDPEPPDVIPVYLPIATTSLAFPPSTLPFVSFRSLATLNERYGALFAALGWTDSALVCAQRALTFTLIAAFLGEPPTP